jgi:hypothetical protein
LASLLLLLSRQDLPPAARPRVCPRLADSAGSGGILHNRRCSSAIGPWSVGGRGGCGWPRLPFYRFLPWPDPPTGSDPPVSSTAWRQDDPAEPPPPPTEPPHPAFHTASGHPTPLALAFVSRCLAPWRTMLVVPVDRGGGKQERDKGVGWVSALCTRRFYTSCCWFVLISFSDLLLDH